MSNTDHAAHGKGLKQNAISFLSNLTIAISSTSPAYSIAATLGPIAAFAGFATPSIMILAFVPMLFIAVACYHMNRADPDCGTTFAWVTKALGPRTGWIGGWSIIVTNILVMPSLADISGRYCFHLFGLADPSAVEVACVGAAWILIVTAISYLGIALSARSQQILLGAEVAVLAIFGVVSLVQVYGLAPPPNAQHIALNWFNPFATADFSKLTNAMVLAVFIYWGWDSCISVNEETTDPGTTPGRAAIVSTFVLVGLYALIAVAAVAVAGATLPEQTADDVLAPLGAMVLGPSLGKVLILAVLSSAVASAQTSILQGARMMFSMARAGAIPGWFGTVQPHNLTPASGTLTMGALSIGWYLGMTAMSADILTDSIAALGLVIAFYYGVTGLSCVVFCRRAIGRNIGNFVFMGMLPTAGTVIMAILLIKACVTPAAAGETSVLGVGGPVLFGIGAVAAGFLLMLLAQRRRPQFFSRKTEVLIAEPAVTSGSIG